MVVFVGSPRSVSVNGYLQVGFLEEASDHTAAGIISGSGSCRNVYELPLALRHLCNGCFQLVEELGPHGFHGLDRQWQVAERDVRHLRPGELMIEYHFPRAQIIRA